MENKLPIKKTQNNKPYLIKVSKNYREAKVMNDYYNRGWIVLKNGWPDLFCYNKQTKQIELVEVKSKSEYRKTRNGKKLGLSQDQLRMHQYLKKAGFVVKIIHVE